MCVGFWWVLLCSWDAASALAAAVTVAYLVGAGWVFLRIRSMDRLEREWLAEVRVAKQQGGCGPKEEAAVLELVTLSPVHEAPPSRAEHEGLDNVAVSVPKESVPGCVPRATATGGEEHEARTRSESSGHDYVSVSEGKEAEVEAMAGSEPESLGREDYATDTKVVEKRSAAQMEATAVPPKPKPEPRARVIQLVETKKAWEASDPERQLSFGDGDIIQVVKSTGKWHLGKLFLSDIHPITDKVMYYPSNYVREVGPEDAIMLINARRQRRTNQ